MPATMTNVNRNDGTEWNCSTCTYLNKPLFLTCEMCGMDRPNQNNNASSGQGEVPQQLQVPSCAFSSLQDQAPSQEQQQQQQQPPRQMPRQSSRREINITGTLIMTDDPADYERQDGKKPWEVVDEDDQGRLDPTLDSSRERSFQERESLRERDREREREREWDRERDREERGRPYGNSDRESRSRRDIHDDYGDCDHDFDGRRGGSHHSRSSSRRDYYDGHGHGGYRRDSRSSRQNISSSSRRGRNRDYYDGQGRRDSHGHRRRDSYDLDVDDASYYSEYDDMNNSYNGNSSFNMHMNSSFNRGGQFDHHSRPLRPTREEYEYDYDEEGEDLNNSFTGNGSAYSRGGGRRSGNYDHASRLQPPRSRLATSSCSSVSGGLVRKPALNRSTSSNSQRSLRTTMTSPASSSAYSTSYNDSGFDDHSFNHVSGYIEDDVSQRSRRSYASGRHSRTSQQGYRGHGPARRLASDGHSGRSSRSCVNPGHRHPVSRTASHGGYGRRDDRDFEEDGGHDSVTGIEIHWHKRRGDGLPVINRDSASSGSRGMLDSSANSHYSSCSATTSGDDNSDYRSRNAFPSSASIPSISSRRSSGTRPFNGPVAGAEIPETVSELPSVDVPMESPGEINPMAVLANDLNKQSKPAATSTGDRRKSRAAMLNNVTKKSPVTAGSSQNLMGSESNQSLGSSSKNDSSRRRKFGGLFRASNRQLLGEDETQRPFQGDSVRHLLNDAAIPKIMEENATALDSPQTRREKRREQRKLNRGGLVKGMMKSVRKLTSLK